MRLLALPLLLVAAPALAGEPPAPLACLTRYYAATAVDHDGRPFLRTARGVEIPWDDGRAKSFDEELDHPDVKDAFSIPYHTGPIRPVTTENDDPGRVRLDPLFAATYGASEAEVGRHIVHIQFLGRPLRVHERARAAFERVAARLAKLVAADPSLSPYLQKLGGTFVWRNIAGTTRPSAHSYGVSLDINVDRSNYWRWERGGQWKNKIPQSIVDAFEAEGFIWGGRWYHFDTMHFEYRPELIDPACALSSTATDRSAAPGGAPSPAAKAAAR